MQVLTCPHCGPREESEFAFAGEAGKTRPPRDCDDRSWAAYLHHQANPKGRARELWRHATGCGAFFILERDTVTHRIIAAEALP